MERKIDDVVETLRNAKSSGRRCSVLIGSGCSVSAGIPIASGFVKRIKEKYPGEYRRAEKKTYPCCMSELAPGERQELIAEYVDKAKLNWAHIALAQLMKSDYVDRILTTNFDPLVVKACALVGDFPAVYDLAASQYFKPSCIPPQSVFYLHGQHTGFVMLNTKDECANHSERLRPVFEDAGHRHVWLVVGYKYVK